MTTKDLDRNAGMSFANVVVVGAKSTSTDCSAGRVVAEKNKQINRLSKVVDSLLEPGLSQSVVCFDDTRDIGIASEVVEKTKGHDIQSHASLEVAVLVSNISPITSNGVAYLNIGSQVAVTVNLGELVKSLICNVCNIELVVLERRSARFASSYIGRLTPMASKS